MENLTILWLDDIRNPEKYFNQKSNSGAFLRNTEFYNRLKSRYNINFVWVKNIEQFSNYIIQNGLPRFISFDHDLGKGLPKGLDCANWLVKYCKETNQKLPNFFVHSANRNGIESINALLNGNIKENKTVNIDKIHLTEIIRNVIKDVLING